LQLDQNLNYLKSFGTPDDLTPPLNPGEFSNPTRFIAALNERFYLIDDGVEDRLASFRDMQGNGWMTYGTTGSGQDQFQFFTP
jgi:hypothetical protein